MNFSTNYTPQMFLRERYSNTHCRVVDADLYIATGKGEPVINTYTQTNGLAGVSCLFNSSLLIPLGFESFFESFGNK